MTEKRVVLLSAGLAVLTSVVPPAISAQETPAVKADRRVLAKVPAKGGCAALLKKKDNPKAASAVYVDQEAWTVSVCHEGRVVSATPAEDKAGIDEASVSDDLVGDLDGDGNLEFVLFYGQCAEGPCQGTHSVHRLEGDRIVKLYELGGELTGPVLDPGRKALELTSFCFNYDFGIAYKYISIVEFSKAGVLQEVPFKDIAKRYPKTLAAFSARPSDRKETAEDRVQALITQAYQGKPWPKLKEAYDQLVAKEKDNLPETHCEPLDIIAKIAK